MIKGLNAMTTNKIQQGARLSSLQNISFALYDINPYGTDSLYEWELHAVALITVSEQAWEYQVIWQIVHFFVFSGDWMNVK